MFSNYTEGNGLLADLKYQLKPEHTQMSRSFLRVNVCKAANLNQQWVCTWLADEAYRLSPKSAGDRALYVNSGTAAHGGIKTTTWSKESNQGWMLNPVGKTKWIFTNKHQVDVPRLFRTVL